MAKHRYKVYCPSCGALLERMPKAARIREKRPQGSRIEKDVARCPRCSEILFLKGTPYWRSLMLLGAGAMGVAAAISVILLVWLMRR